MNLIVSPRINEALWDASCNATTSFFRKRLFIPSQVVRHLGPGDQDYLDWLDQYNYHNSLQACLIEEKGYSVHDADHVQVSTPDWFINEAIGAVKIFHFIFNYRITKCLSNLNPECWKLLKQDSVTVLLW